MSMMDLTQTKAHADGLFARKRFVAFGNPVLLLAYHT